MNVADEIAAGEFSNHSEVLRAGLPLLRVRTTKQRALLAEIEAGWAEFEAGTSLSLMRERLHAIADGAKRRARMSATTPA